MRANKQAGFTMVEALIAASALVMVTGAAGYALALSQKAVSQGMAVTKAKENVSRALAVMLPEIRQSGSKLAGSDVNLQNSQQTLVFRKNVGFDGLKIIWSGLISYSWQEDGTITRTGPATTAAGSPAITSVIANDINENFEFALNDDETEVTIIISSTVPLLDGSTSTYTVTENVTLRN
ncbi:MAG: PilW family protein [Planctomycetota bacterium]|jgi:type II secretory pathway pseudopilin PulG